MFKNPLSFNGRIRRMEYTLSILFRLIYLFISMMILVIAGDFGLPKGLHNAVPFLIPLLWFSFAQSTKRCHDLGKSGWFQLIPFYAIRLILIEGIRGANQYGSDPKSDPYSSDRDIN